MLCARLYVSPLYVCMQVYFRFSFLFLCFFSHCIRVVLHFHTPGRHTKLILFHFEDETLLCIVPRRGKRLGQHFISSPHFQFLNMGSPFTPRRR